MKMKAKDKMEIFFGSVLVCFYLAVIIASYQYNHKARLMPLVIAFPCIIMAAVQLVSVLRGKKKKKVISIEDEMFQKTMDKIHVEVMEEKKVKKTDREATIALLKAAGWVMLYVLMVFLFGFLITIPVYTVIFMRSQDDGWVASLSTAFGLWLTIYLVFVVLAKISLYDALIFRLLGGAE
jgi:hypothetical protein